MKKTLAIILITAAVIVGAVFAPAIAADACVLIEELYLKSMDE